MKPKLKFGDKLSGLCAMELAAAHGNEARMGEMIERLSNSLAFTIAIATGGKAKAMQEMLTGVEGYLYEAATGHQRMGDFMETTMPEKRDGK